ncbi:recombinase RecT [Actinomadura nitritigenes]|uniref:recombinase RecT n=1 Tax=Actinomadura nitritigenes TaxID=134602 RepID=UPI003D8E6A6B
MSGLKDRVKDKTAQDGQAAAPVTDLAQNDGQLAWLESRRTYFTEALPRHVDEGHFIQTALSAMPALRNCTNQSIFTALMECARFGLAPDGKHAAVIPYGKVATFQPMYQGLKECMYRSGKIDSLVFDWIRQGDTWHYDQGSRDGFSHRPDLESPDYPGKPLLAYAFCWMKGGARSQIIFLNRKQAEHIRDNYSKAYRNAESNGKRDSAWHTNFDDMWAKSAVIRLAKRVPMSAELTELVLADERAEGYGNPPPVTTAMPLPPEAWQDSPAEARPVDRPAEPGTRPDASAARPDEQDDRAGDPLHYSDEERREMS